jgi:hypothetical protein
MTLQRLANAGTGAALLLLTVSAVFWGSSQLAHADTLAEQITCITYARLHVSNPELFANFDASLCETGNGGGGHTPTDMCPNIDGIQETVPSGKVVTGGNCVDAPTGGGENPGGGGTMLPSDSGSTDPSPSAGGGNGGTPSYASGGTDGGSGSGGVILGAATTTETSAATTTPSTSCDTYLTTFIRMGQKNDVDQVKRLQNVLKDYEAADVDVSGEYDSKTEFAVRMFQKKYASDVLTPWNISEPTGYVFLTTRKKVNEVYCRNSQTFPLTAEEQQHIELVKKAETAPKTVVAAQPKPAKPAVPVKEEPVATTTVTEEPAVDVTGNPISNFFRRLLNRFR